MSLARGPSTDCSNIKVSFFLTNHIYYSAHIVLLSIAFVLICGDDEGERIVVVTHGGLIRSLYEIQIARLKARKVDKIINTSINVFRLGRSM